MSIIALSLIGSGVIGAAFRLRSWLSSPLTATDLSLAAADANA